MITPLRDFILLEKIKNEETSPAGVIRIVLEDEKITRGRVVSTGPDAHVAPGAIVLFSVYSSIDIEDESRKKLLLVPEKDVFAVVG